MCVLEDQDLFFTQRTSAVTPSSLSPALVAENGMISAWHLECLAQLPVACVILHESLYTKRDKKNSSLSPKAFVLLIHRAYCVR